MCGIAGILQNSAFNKHSLTEDVQGMLRAIRHRGPDESGTYVDDHFGMGNVRLCVIDLQHGIQPMRDESGNYRITYNGEVFNADELRVHLKQKGYSFKTESDTEVVIQMYAHYGADCLDYFNGQFAFAIWSEKDKELFLARDRVGICPLFYWSQHGAFAFCSEIKGLFNLNFIQKAISAQSLAQICTFWTTLPGQTPFENIFQLPPGCYLTYKDGQTVIKKYWEVRFPPSVANTSYDMNGSAEHLSNLLADAVKIRLRADVPVGAYLSGGLDSGITTAFMTEHIKGGRPDTFSIGFTDKSYDESPYQKEASEFLRTHHASFSVSSDDILSHFSKAIWHAEFPVLRTSPTPMMLLSDKTRQQGVKVIITGEGADEFLGGYNIFKENKIRRFWANQPHSTCRPGLLSTLYPYLPQTKNREHHLMAKMFFGYKLEETSHPLYSHLLRWHNTSRIIHFFSDTIKDSLRYYDPLQELSDSLPENFMQSSPLARAQYLEISLFMSNYLLSSQGERMMMAHGVEGRYPFLDHRIMEYSNLLPDQFKLNGLNEKYILKKIGKGKIPSSIIERSKQPYRAPIKSVFSTDSSLIRELISEKSLKKAGLFDYEKVNLLYSKLRTSANVSEIDEMAITLIVSTQLIYRQFVDPDYRKSL